MKIEEMLGQLLLVYNLNKALIFSPSIFIFTLSGMPRLWMPSMQAL